MITGKNYIGNSLSAKGKTTYKTFNPQTNTENELNFTEATSEEISEAVELAATAFKTYHKISGKEKAVFLNAIADEILACPNRMIALIPSKFRRRVQHRSRLGRVA